MGLIAWNWNPIDWIKGAISWFGGVVSEAASGLLGDIFEWIAGLLIRGIVWLFEVIMDFVSKATTPDLGAQWFSDGPMAIAKRIAAYLLILFVILAIAEAVWNRDGGQFLRSTAQDVPRVLFLEAMLIAGTTAALAAGDYFSTQSLDLFGANIEAFPAALSEATNGLVFGVGVLVICLVALFLLLTLVFLTFELAIREGLILVLVPVVAVLLATEVYRPTKGMGGRAMRLLGVTIAIKPMVALCLAIGAAAIGQQAATTTAPAHLAAPVPAPDPAAAVSDSDFTMWVASQDAVGIPEWFLTRENCVVIDDPGSPDPPRCAPLERVGGVITRADGTPAIEQAAGEEDPEAIEEAETAAVAPTFGLMIAGLAVMVLAAMSPFVLMRLISLEAGESHAWRQGVAGSARNAAGSVTSFASGGAVAAGGAAGAMGRAAGVGKPPTGAGAAATKAGS